MFNVGVFEKCTFTYEDVNEFVRTVTGIGQDENFDFLDDEFDIKEEDFINSTVDSNQSCQASALVDPNIQQTKKRFKSVSESEINKLKCPITETTTDRSTKWAVGLIKGWYLRFFTYNTNILQYNINAYWFNKTFLCRWYNKIYYSIHAIYFETTVWYLLQTKY